jgi:hypothetical protein
MELILTPETTFEDAPDLGVLIVPVVRGNRR